MVRRWAGLAVLPLRVGLGLPGPAGPERDDGDESQEDAEGQCDKPTAHEGKDEDGRRQQDPGEETDDLGCAEQDGAEAAHSAIMGQGDKAEQGVRRAPGANATMKTRMPLLGAGALGAGLAAVLAPRTALHAAAATWRPFVLVAGLLLIGVVAGEDGVFTWVASLLDRYSRRRLLVYLTSMALVAVVTALLNLDTSVAFLTPVLIHVGRRGGGEQRLLYGCVFMSNAASLLLPGSNLTNLLVLANEHASGSVFLAHMALPWTAAVAVTALVVAVAFRPGDGHAGDPPAEPGSPAPRPLGVLGIGVAIGLMLVFPDSAPLVGGVGVILAAVRLAQRRIGIRQIQEGVDVASLAGVFAVAVSLGTLARTWSYPGHLMMQAGSAATAGVGAVSSVLINNLPAAVLLGSRMPAHPQSLLFGLNIGPNLAVTGSLSALIWWQAARSVGARPSALRYSAVGVVLVPLTLSAALVAARVVG